ncbi:MAG: IS1595 family transposase [Xanthobacteraceae bacterium]
MSNAFAAAHFQSPETAREWLEKLRWPEGPICSHCGTIGHAYKTKKPGWYRCAEKECRKDFTVTTGTVMERSHIPLNKWLMAFYLLNASKKGMSAHQLHRALNLDYKTAWFMCHRIREAMRSGGLGPLGGEGKIVEVDETYHGKTEKPRVSPQRRGRPYNPRGSRGPKDKRAIVSLVERGGNVRSFHVPVADQATVEKIVNENIAHESRLHTDESKLYFNAADTFAAHETVTHYKGEYARGDVTTNSVEGYFSIFKRGMKGTYQHCKEKHLHRYLAEFDFRYSNRVRLGVNDVARADRTLKGIVGKRLTYRPPHH